MPDGIIDCPLCRDHTAELCHAQALDGEDRVVVCTRPKGHGGKHTACGVNTGSHPLWAWGEDLAVFAERGRNVP